MQRVFRGRCWPLPINILHAGNSAFPSPHGEGGGDFDLRSLDGVRLKAAGATECFFSECRQAEVKNSKLVTLHEPQQQ